MEILRKLYWNQYVELKERGKESVARKQGTALVTIAIALILLGTVFLIMSIFPDAMDWMEDLIDDIFGRRKGRMVGKIIAIIPFAVVYGIIKLSLDREPVYDKLIYDFGLLSEDEQHQASEQGKMFFFLSLGYFVIAMLIFFVVTSFR